MLLVLELESSLRVLYEDALKMMDTGVLIGTSDGAFLGAQRHNAAAFTPAQELSITFAVEALMDRQ